MISYFSADFLIYLGRWLLSGVVMLPFIWYLIKIECCKGRYQEYVHLILVQIIGSFIFWYLDQWIFKG